MSKEATMRGTVKRFNSQKGYGFIATGTDDVFVHQSDIRMEGFRMLDTGQEVEFTLLRTDRGLKATNVVPLSDAPYKER